MSFILDALRKSENERQQQAPSEFSQVPSSPDRERTPRWLWVLGALLAINLIVVAALLLRPSGDSPQDRVAAEAASTAAAPASEPQTAPQTKPQTEVVAEPSFADRIEIARRQQPVRPAATAPAPEPRSQAATAGSRTTQSSTPSAQSAAASLPSFDEVRVRGLVTLPDLHIDLHVYNDTPARRFVSINMKKYRENDLLDAGPLVQQITSDGVILQYQGTRFALQK